MSLARVIKDILEAETTKRRALATLHTELGYATGRALAEAILEATEKAPRQERGVSTGKVRKKRKGRGLAPEHRQAIADALEAGTNGAQVARDFGVSYPTVHEIKKSLGLVKARAKRKKAGKRRGKTAGNG